MRLTKNYYFKAAPLKIRNYSVCCLIFKYARYTLKTPYNPNTIPRPILMELGNPV